MKNILTSIMALLLLVWYSLSVIGFDVHTCSSSGNSYIATVISGTHCKDIHPDHHQNTCSCCHHHETENDEHDGDDETKPCCTDEWQMIDLTGLKTSDEHSDEFGIDIRTVYCDLLSQYHNSIFRITAHERACYKPDSGKFKDLDFQQAYSIWRI